MANLGLPCEIEILVGDICGDGHRHRESFVVRSNFPKARLVNAFEIGSASIGFNLSTSVGAQYEDTGLEGAFAHLLKNAGIDPLLFVEEEPVFITHKEGCKKPWCNCPSYVDPKWENVLSVAAISPVGFFSLWLEIAKLGRPELEYEVIVKDYESRINIGGYGLFS